MAMRSLLAAALLSSLAACNGSSPADAGNPMDAGVSCPATIDGGTQHGSVTADETWTAAGSPHQIKFDSELSAVVTIEPCAVVTVPAGVTITVNTGGKLIANGTAQKPVTFKNVDGAGNWASIRFLGGTGHFSYTSFINGGDPLNSQPDFQAALDVRSGIATLTGPDPVLFVDHVTISGSATQGIYAHTGGALTADSQQLTITGSAGHAATWAPNLLESLPTGTYSGNAHDDILLPDDLPGQIVWDTTVHDRGVPYYAGGTNQAGVISVGTGTATIVLTVEPGVVWKFKKDTGQLSVDPGGSPSHGVLVAKGTAAKPIVFTSNEPTPMPGDWVGIWLGGDDARNSLDFVRIEYAGKLVGNSGSNSCQSVQVGTTTNGGALRVYKAPPASLVTNTAFVSSATNAIDRGWRDDLMPSFVGGGNTFMNIAQCNETFPRDMNGACPAAPLPCPK